MSFRKLLLAGATLVASAAAITPANASIIDRPHFKVLGVVIVWAAEESTGTAAMATDFIIDNDSGSADTDLIGGTDVDGRTVLTGTLNATADSSSTAGLGSVLRIEDTTSVIQNVDTDAAGTFAAFDVTDASLTSDGLEYESSFYIASNTVFNIVAEATQVEQSGDFELSDIGYNLDVTATGTDGALTFGGNAQNPNGTFPTVANLAAMGPNTSVFEGTLRTAATPGSIVGQSVRFDATYTLGSGGAYDLSQGAGEIKADVVYTVFVP